MSSTDIYHPSNPSEIQESVMDADRFYVYVYFDPFTQEPFYVGKGCGNRAWAHVREAVLHEHKNTYKLNKIRSIFNKGMEPIVRIVYDGLSEFDALTKEASLIAHYDISSRGGVLTNKQHGWESAAFDSSRRYIDQTVYTLTHYDGRKFKGTRRVIEQELGVDPSNICFLIKGRYSNVKGWFLGDQVTDGITFGREYTLVSGYTGDVITGTQQELGIKCRITGSEVCAVVRGRKKHADGWFLNEVDPNIILPKTKYKFIHADTGEVRWLNQREFCEQIGSKFSTLIKGKRNHVKRWCHEYVKDGLAGPVHDVHTFVHISGITFTGTRAELNHVHGVDEKMAHAIVKLGRERRGWRLQQ